VVNFTESNKNMRTNSTDSILPAYTEEEEGSASGARTARAQKIIDDENSFPKLSSEVRLFPEFSYNELPPVVLAPESVHQSRSFHSFWPAMCSTGRVFIPGENETLINDGRVARIQQLMPIAVSYLQDTFSLSQKLGSEQDINPEDSISEVCLTCSKVIADSAKKGSITAWLFKDDTCDCLNPAPPSTGGRSTISATIEEESRTSIGSERYQILDSLGHGSAGWVYRAVDNQTNKIVAVKVLRKELMDKELIVRRFKQEVKASFEINHPNLVSIHGYFQDKEDAPYLVMEHLDGENLNQLIKRKGSLPLPTAIAIFLGIADGLAHLHQRGIIHRDIKPSNVVIGETDKGLSVKIVDFGFAKFLEAQEHAFRLTQTGEAFGSPQYMSPEQCLGQSVDERSDIYSLGCLMYEALCGRPPLVGKNVLATVAKQVKEKVSSLNKQQKIVPTNMDNLVLNCLGKEPEERYQSMVQLAADLRKLQSGSSVKRIGNDDLIANSRKLRCRQEPSKNNTIKIWFVLLLMCVLLLGTAMVVRILGTW
jgi:tRNA A-37 threonylcarbamoyl transferase component Bud32